MSSGGIRNFNWIVLTNCTAGDDAEFNAWYDEIHVPDLLRIPGIVAVRRGRLTPEQTVMVDGKVQFTRAAELPFKYLAIYSLQTDDPQAVLEEVARRAGTPEMMLSETFAEAHTTLFEDIGGVVGSGDLPQN